MPPKRKPAAPQANQPAVPSQTIGPILAGKNSSQAPQTLLKTPYNTSSATITEHPPKTFQFDNAVPQAFDTSMFPPCLRPLVHYSFEQPNLSRFTTAFFEPFPFTAEHVIFIFTELIENDLYSNVSTQDWAALTARMNTQFLTKFDFRDVRHFALRVLLNGYMSWIHQFRTYDRYDREYNLNTVIASIFVSPPLALLGFYYQGILLHSAIKEGAFDVLSTSTLIFPDPIYEFHLSTGFIPPTRRTVHDINGNVTIHNPTQLSTVFEPSLHANNPHWAHTNNPQLYSTHSTHPAHNNIPFVPKEQQTLPLPKIPAQPIVFHDVQQQPQQHITITNTSPNPTSGMSVWGDVSVPQIADSTKQFSLLSSNLFSNPVDSYKLYLASLHTPSNSQSTTPKSFLTEKSIDVHVIDPTLSRNLPSSTSSTNSTFINPYEHLSTVTPSSVKVHQINKFINCPVTYDNQSIFHSTLSKSFPSDEEQRTTYGKVFPRLNPKATILRNNHAVKTTFSRGWIRAHIDRYGDLGAYLCDQITQFNLFMCQTYPRHYFESYYSSYSIDKPIEPYLTTTLQRQNQNPNASPIPPADIEKEFQPGVYNPSIHTMPTNLFGKVFNRPYDGFKFENWSSDINTIPDCTSLRQFSTARRNASNIRITPTKSWADVVPTLTQPIIEGVLAAENPIDTPLRHPLHKAESLFPPLTDAEKAKPNTSARTQLTTVIPSSGVWGYYDDGFYTNNSMIYSIRPPESLSLLDLTQLNQLTSTHPSGLPPHLLLHHEEQRFFFILQQKTALYFLRRALRRVYLELFYRPSASDQESTLQIVITSTLPILTTLYSPHPQILARQFMLKKKLDGRILSGYDDILLRLTHYCDLKTELGLNMQIVSRFNQYTFFNMILSHTFLDQLHRQLYNFKQFAAPVPSRISLPNDVPLVLPTGVRSNNKTTIFAPAFNAIVPHLPQLFDYFSHLSTASDISSTEYLNYEPGSREASEYIAKLIQLNNSSERNNLLLRLVPIFTSSSSSYNRGMQNISPPNQYYQNQLYISVSSFINSLCPPSTLARENLSHLYFPPPQPTQNHHSQNNSHHYPINDDNDEDEPDFNSDYDSDNEMRGSPCVPM